MFFTCSVGGSPLQPEGRYQQEQFSWAPWGRNIEAAIESGTTTRHSCRTRDLPHTTLVSRVTSAYFSSLLTFLNRRAPPGYLTESHRSFVAMAFEPERSHKLWWQACAMHACEACCHVSATGCQGCASRSPRPVRKQRPTRVHRCWGQDRLLGWDASRCEVGMALFGAAGDPAQKRSACCCGVRPTSSCARPPRSIVPSRGFHASGAFGKLLQGGPASQRPHSAHHSLWCD